MRFFIVTLLFILQLCAITPFSLNGIKHLSVHVADYSNLFEKSMKTELESRMHKHLNKLGVKTKGFHNETFILLIKSQMVGKTTLLFLDLMVAGDMQRKNQKHLTFGMSYLLKDNVEVEDAGVDVIDSLEYLLEEFDEQFLQDNEE